MSETHILSTVGSTTSGPHHEESTAVRKPGWGYAAEHPPVPCLECARLRAQIAEIASNIASSPMRVLEESRLAGAALRQFDFQNQKIIPDLRAQLAVAQEAIRGLERAQYRSAK